MSGQVPTEERWSGWAEAPPGHRLKGWSLRLAAGPGDDADGLILHPAGDGTIGPGGLEVWLGAYQGDADPDWMGMTLSREAALHLADALARYARLGVLGPPTKVTNVRGKAAAELAAAGVVYVGRAVLARNGLGDGPVTLPKHPLANPFRLPKGAGRETRKACVAEYRNWLRSDAERVRLAKTLRGRVLGCWCGEWYGVGDPGFDCHAIEIARVAEEA